jgi:cation transport protein ChaC
MPRYQKFSTPLTDRERNADLDRMLDTRPPGDDIRVFAYGSLIWNPCFTAETRTTACLADYKGAFNFRSVVSRGTPENPGLGLGLEAGGASHGIAFRLAPARLRADLETLWRREMYYDVYRSRWLPLETPSGPVTAIVFVTNPDHPGFAGDLSIN